MITFSYVEEYVQFIAGTRDKDNNTSSTWLSQPAISLARYDKSVIRSFAEQIEKIIAFTDRQSQLAYKLVDKYRKQLYKLGVAMPDEVTMVPFKFSIRQVDRTRRLYLDNDRLVMQFPFNTELINLIKEFAKESTGSITYSGDNKNWTVALTEGCVNWAVAFGKAFEFEIPDDVDTLFNKILENEQTPYKIELCRKHGELTITNAADSLLEYIAEHIGDIVDDNLDKLLDMSAMLGYTISSDLLVNAKSADLLTGKNVQIIPGDGNISKIAEYARAYNKFPIISYTPNLLGKNDSDQLSSLFAQDEVVDLNTLRKNSDIITENTKLIHMGTKAAKAYTGAAPIVICYGNMSFGSVNSLLLQRASKVFYYCNPILKAT
tara:strand:+ start:3539 stop:4669 length:1131 start_codon:yes stop_codon:yes gene_type:complete